MRRKAVRWHLGTDSDGTLVVPTLWAEVGRIFSSADPSTDPSLPVWAQLQAQINHIQGSTGGISPTAYGLPVLYLEGDTAPMTKDNPVVLHYSYGSLAGTASVRWQGASSLGYPKKNYSVKFDRAFEAAEGWGPQQKYCLKANYIDFSHARNVVSAKLWGQVVKSRENVPAQLAGLPNSGAVDGFPVCLFTNGEYQGIYTFNIPKDGWMFGMGNGQKECIVSANCHSDATRFDSPALEDMTQMFRYCGNITDTNGMVIPGGVSMMNEAFAHCAKMVGTITVNAENITSFADAFLCAPLGTYGKIRLTGSSAQLAELAATNADGYVEVLTV